MYWPGRPQRNTVGRKAIPPVKCLRPILSGQPVRGSAPAVKGGAERKAWKVERFSLKLSRKYAIIKPLPVSSDGAAWSGIEAAVKSLTRNHVSTLEVQTAEKPVTIRVCGQVQIVNWGLFYPVVLPNFHGLNFAGKWL